MGFSSCSSEEIKFIIPAKKSVKNPFQTTMMPPNWYQLSSNDRPPYTYPNFRSLTSFSKDFDTVKFPSNWEEICLNGQPDKMEFCDIYNRYFFSTITFELSKTLSEITLPLSSSGLMPILARSTANLRLESTGLAGALADSESFIFFMSGISLGAVKSAA